jgi:hypothetical protein
MNIESIVRNFTMALATSEAIHPTPCAVADGIGEWVKFALDMSAEEVADLGFSLARDKAVKEFFVSLDCRNDRPDHLAQYHSALIIIHVHKMRMVRIGVMEYGWENEGPLVGEVQWDDPYWAQKYQKLMLHLARQYRRPELKVTIETEGESRRWMN